MSNEIHQNEFRFRSGSKILNILRQFSETEKVIFGFLTIVLIVTALSLLFGVSDYFKADVPAYGGELREGIIGLPRTINPTLAITDADRDLSALIYSGLLKYSNNELKPDIASSYSISENGLVYDFKIRSDVYFQDGKQLTADDIEFTIQKINDPTIKSPRRADWANVVVKKINNFEIQFILKQAYSPFITNLTIGIIPKHIWEKINADQFIFSEYNIQPIGSGPYMVKNVNKDSGGIPTEYVLETWSKYYANEPYISTLSFSFFADQEKAINALNTNSIDGLASIPPSIAKKIAENNNSTIGIVTSPLPRIFGLFFNQSENKVLADNNVRRALELTVDRKLIIEKVLNGYGEALYGPIPTQFMGNDIHYATSTNQISAQSILEKNGWKKTKDGTYEKKSGKNASTTLGFTIFTADSTDLKETADLLKEAWNNFGARVDVRTFNSADLYQNIIRTRKYDALLFGEQIGKDRDLYAFWHSSQRNAPGLNVSMYTNSNVDKILENIRNLNDDEQRENLYNQLNVMITTDIPAIFLYTPDFIYAIPKDLQGVQLNSITTAADRWNSIEKWYLLTERVWKIFTK